jgi:hypothetical protein
LKPFGFVECENKKIDIGNIKATDLFRKYIKLEMCMESGTRQTEND